MAKPEERTDGRTKLPTRIPFAGPHPGTVEHDWQASPASTGTPPEPAARRAPSSLSRATKLPRQRGDLAGGSGAGPAVAERAEPRAPEPSLPAVAARPARPVGPSRSRVLPAAVAASILVAGALWWSQQQAAPPTPQSAPTLAPAPTMRITAPGTDASAGVGSDPAATAGPGPTADATATGGPASPGGSPKAAKPAKPAPTGAAAAVNSSGRNLALGSRATASSVEGDHWAAANAVDGDLTTRWSSQFSDPQWWMVDLGKRWEVSEILLHWENAHATAYRVEVSTDGKKWKQVYRATESQGGDVTVQVPKIPAKLVRMSGTKRSTDYGYSLLDVEVR